MTNTEVPRIIIPEDLLFIKYIQVDIGEGAEAFMRLGDPTVRHARFLEDLLNELGINFKTRKSGGGGMVPVPRGDGYKLVGAGDGRIKILSREIIAFGTSNSLEYGRGFNQEHSERITPYLPEGWKLKLERAI